MNTKFNTIVNIFEDESLNDRQKKEKLINIRTNITIDGVSSSGTTENDNEVIDSEYMGVEAPSSFRSKMKIWENMREQVEPKSTRALKKTNSVIKVEQNSYPNIQGKTKSKDSEKNVSKSGTNLKKKKSVNVSRFVNSFRSSKSLRSSQTQSLNDSEILEKMESIEESDF